MTPQGRLQRGDRIRNKATGVVYKVTKRFGNRPMYAVEVVDEEGKEHIFLEIDHYIERGMFEYIGK